MSTTPYYGLTLPPSGETGWATPINANFTAIDAALHALATGGSTGPAGPQGATGAVGMIFTGPWSSILNYVVTDVVTYNGSTYIAIANNVNTPPDTNTNSWTLLASAGAAGPAGPTGPQGPAGSGAGVTFPITLIEGGTGSTNAPGARSNLGAAASGVNGDITALTALVAATVTSGQAAISITSPGGEGNAITFNNGTAYGGFTTAGNGFLNNLTMAGNLLCGGLQAAGGITTNQIGNATPGQPLNIVALLQAAFGMLIEGSTPSASSGQIGIGASVAATASDGGGQATPAHVLAYLIINNQGTLGKIPIYAV